LTWEIIPEPRRNVPFEFVKKKKEKEKPPTFFKTPEHNLSLTT
jgi:hypothetical protein